VVVWVLGYLLSLVVLATMEPSAIAAVDGDSGTPAVGERTDSAVLSGTVV
jgi:hypothetical protein